MDVTSRSLLESHEGLWRLTVENPFVEGLIAGTLSDGTFDRFLVQAGLFADGLFVAHARVLAKAPEEDRSVLLGGLSLIDDDLRWIRRLRPSEGRLHTVNRAYLDHLFRASDASYAEGVTALWTVYRMIDDEWSRVASAEGPNRAFGERLTREERRVFVGRLEPIVNAALASASPVERGRATEAFAQVVHYTMDFWLMTLERELV